MDLPMYFPTYMNELLTGLEIRPVFQDFGRHGHVDVSLGESVCCVPQFQHVNVLHNYRHICAKVPAIPLRNTPVPVTFPLHDLVNGNIHDRPARIRQFIRILRHLYPIIDGKKDNGGQWLKTFQAGKKALDALGALNEQHVGRVARIQNNMPPSLRTLCDRYADLAESPLIENFNGMYSGGVLACVKVDHGQSGHLLIHAEGQNLNQLSVTQVVEAKPLLEWHDVMQTQMDPVFQVDATSVCDSVFICTRHKESCVMLSVPSAPDDRGKGFTHLATQHFKNSELPMSVSTSPFGAGECLIGTEKGAVYIWSADSGLQNVIAERLPRFACQDSWCQVQHGCHPRQLIVTDRTAAEIFDHRSSLGVDLFALPSKHVPRREGIMAVHTHDKSAPYHIVATDHCLFLLDQRFPGTPVMQWYPDLKGPLQYLSSADFKADMSTTSSVVMVASQYPPEAMIYPFDHGNGHSVKMPVNPWRVSGIRDISCMDLASGCIEHMVCEKRFTTSLSGVAVTPVAGAGCLSTYQCDSYGEVFYQYYETPDDSFTNEKTCSQVTGEDKQTLPCEIREHVQTWLSRLQQQVDVLRTQWMNKRKRDELRHIKCPEEVVQTDSFDSSLCLQCSMAIIAESDSTTFDSGMCLSCRARLHIIQDELPDVEYNVPHLGIDVTCLNSCAQPLADYCPNSAHTQVYLSLVDSSRNGTSSEVFKQRETERSELKRMRQEKRKAVRERRKAKCRTGNTNINSTGPTAEEQGQEENIIEDMISNLSKPPKIPENMSDEENSMCSVISPISETKNTFSDHEQKSDISSHRRHSEDLGSQSAQGEMRLKALLSLSDDEDFFADQEVSSVFSNVKRNTQLYTDLWQQTPQRKSDLMPPYTVTSLPASPTTEDPLTLHFDSSSPAPQYRAGRHTPRSKPLQSKLSPWTPQTQREPSTPLTERVQLASPVKRKGPHTQQVQVEVTALHKRASPPTQRKTSPHKDSHFASPSTPKVKRTHITGF